MKVIVTGAAGELANYVLHDLPAGIEVIGLDTEAAAELDIPCLRCDIRDPDALAIALDGADVVLHMAGIKTYRKGNEQLIWDVNATGTFNLFEAAGRAGVERVVFASSICAVGPLFHSRGFQPEVVPVDEDHPCHPDDTYGVSKVVGERLGEAFASRHGGTCVSLRLASVWFQKPRDVANNVRERRLIDDPEAGAAYLWSYVDARDVAQAIRLALTYGEPGTHERFHIGACDTLSRLSTDELVTTWFPHAQVQADHDAAVHWPVWAINRARTRLGYRPQYSWREGDLDIPGWWTASGA